MPAPFACLSACKDLLLAGAQQQRDQWSMLQCLVIMIVCGIAGGIDAHSHGAYNKSCGHVLLSPPIG